MTTASKAAATASAPPTRSRDDYRLIGGAGERAHAAGLVNAPWYQCPVPRAELKALMKRDDDHALRDTALWYALILASGALFVHGWTAGWSGWALAAAYLLYATLYSSPSDSRWHECGHGTAFKTRWMNDVVYQLASFQLTRRPTRWRWSHARHHTDTLVTGRDPEFNVTLPPDIPALLLNFFALRNVPNELWTALRHATGHLSDEEKTFIPEMAWPSAVRTSRIWMLTYALIAGSALATQSWLPLLLLGPLPSMAGAWLMHTLGLTQHAGLPENTLDHRLNSRTILMGPVLRFLYWNMNFHVEHHMFPLVPYHALPKLHELMKDDCPPPYTSTPQALAEILPAIWRQRRDTGFFIARPLPTATQ
jgi:fatty acid desaturase